MLACGTSVERNTFLACSNARPGCGTATRSAALQDQPWRTAKPSLGDAVPR